MSSPSGTIARRLGTIVVVAVATAVLLWLGARSAARAADPGSLTQQISAGQDRVSALSGAVGQENGRLHQLDAGIAALQAKIARVQADLDAKQAELLKLRRQLKAARARLASLKAFESRARAVLAQQLVASYETDPPNLVSVVLESNGFADLLERLSFAKRIRTQDQQVIAATISARDRVAAEAVRLGGLEGREQAVTARVLAERNQIDAAKLTLVGEQTAVARARDHSVGQLDTARHQVATLRRQLAQVQAEQAEQARQAAARQVIQSGTGTPATVGDHVGANPIPGFSIGRDDMGVDASAAAGAGIYAPLASHLVQVLENWYDGQPLLLFQFDSPPAGAPSSYWYLAEQIDPVTTTIGTGFQAGQRIASFAASGTGIEIGWGSATSNARTLAGEGDPGAADPPAGSTTSWGESFKAAFGIS